MILNEQRRIAFLGDGIDPHTITVLGYLVEDSEACELVIRDGDGQMVLRTADDDVLAALELKVRRLRLDLAERKWNKIREAVQ